MSSYTSLLAGVAEDLAELLVNAQEAALEVDLRSIPTAAFSNVLRNIASLLPEGLLGPLPLGDVPPQGTRRIARPPSQKARLLTSTGKTVPSLAAEPGLERDGLSFD